MNTELMAMLPPAEEVAELEPEELGPMVLRYLKRPNAGKLNRYNFGTSLPSGPLGERLMEAWMWLEHQGFLAPSPGEQGEWRYITRRGHQVASDGDFESYSRASMFPDGLDSSFALLVRPLFVRGDYDTAVFRAFKEVEVRVRRKADMAPELIGRDLMNKALGTGAPKLLVKGGHKDDQSAIRELFAGAISACKNPSSHHEVQFDDPREAVDMICFANHLLRIVDRLMPAT